MPMFFILTTLTVMFVLFVLTWHTCIATAYISGEAMEQKGQDVVSCIAGLRHLLGKLIVFARLLFIVRVY